MCRGWSRVWAGVGGQFVAQSGGTAAVTVVAEELPPTVFTITPDKGRLAEVLGDYFFLDKKTCR